MPMDATAALPPHVAKLLSDLPAHVTRRAGAEIISRYLFPISGRTLERWPMRFRLVNGKATVPLAELLAEAWRRHESAAVVIAGRQKPAAVAQDNSLIGKAT